MGDKLGKPLTVTQAWPRIPKTTRPKVEEAPPPHPLKKKVADKQSAPTT